MNVIKKFLLKRKLKKLERTERALDKVREKAFDTKYRKEIGGSQNQIQVGRFITKDANITLLFFVLLVLGIFLGGTIFYQYLFTDINSRYNTKLAELNNITSELESKKSELGQTTQALVIKNKREEDLSQQYELIKSDKDSLEKQKTKLESDISTLNREVELRNQEIARLKVKIDQLEEEIDDLKEQQ